MNSDISKFSAISSAKIIRHAVSIDERRAKFRADLVSHGMAARRDENLRDGIMAPEAPRHDWMHRSTRYKAKPKPKPQPPQPPSKPADRRATLGVELAEHIEAGRGRKGVDESHVFRYRGHSRSQSHLSHSTNDSVADPHYSFGLEDRQRRASLVRGTDGESMVPPFDFDDDISSDGDEDDQDIEELWFPGGHADIGGGWEVEEGETPLSHVPLVWIVREAQRSGLEFDEEKMEALDCLDNSAAEANNMPVIEISTSAGEEKIEGNQSRFKQLLTDTAVKGKLHDCLRFNTGSPAGTVIRWRVMEWLPFRRLDLTDDGKWKPIRW